MPDNQTITVSKIVDAPRERVWEAWTVPGEVSGWWAPKGMSAFIMGENARPEKVWRITLHAADGTSLSSDISFTELKEPTELLYTYEPGKDSGLAPVETAIVFEDMEAKTKLTVTLHFATPEEMTAHKAKYGTDQGALQALERFGEYVRSNPTSEKV